MTALGHVAVASMVRVPSLRIAWGFISHAILDRYMPEYRPKGLHLTDPKTWKKNWFWLLLQVLGPLLFCTFTGDWWALTGLLPDVIEGLYVWLVRKFDGEDVWMTGDLLFFFHRKGWSFNSTKHYSFLTTTLLELSLVVIALI